MEVGSAKAILKWRQYQTSLSAEKPRLIISFHQIADFLSILQEDNVLLGANLILMNRTQTAK